MMILRYLLLATGFCFCCTTGFAEEKEPTTPDSRVISWEKKAPPLPDKIGFAGMYAGSSHGALIAAGGANFPHSPTPAAQVLGSLAVSSNGLSTATTLIPTRDIATYSPFAIDGIKIYYDTIFVLDPSSGQWQQAQARLPRPLAYGVSLTYGNKVLCFGGNDATRHYREAFSLEWQSGKVIVATLPPLPETCTQMCGAIVGDTVYIAGGLKEPSSTKANHTFWSLDLSIPNDQRQWQSLPPWPGPERFQAVAGAQNGKCFLFSGIRLQPDDQGKPKRVLPYLNDAYAYDPVTGTWKQLGKSPRPIAAAPSPAIPLGQTHLAVLGGVDGSRIDISYPEHPGFRSDILVYHEVTNTWAQRGSMPEGASRVTAPVAPWGNGYVIVSGEKSPKVRSPDVYFVEPAPRANTFGLINWMVLGGYLLALMAMGAYFSRRGKDTEDFFLAGRRIPWWAAGLSIYGTQLSAITFMAIPAIAYSTNWTRMLGNVAILLITPFIIYLFLPFFRRLRVLTAYEYLEQRFSIAVRILGSLTFILYHLGRMGIVLLLPALALATVTGIDVFLCIAIMGIVCIIYTVLGGIEAVIWTDVLQVIVLVAGALFCLFLIAGEVGGPGELFRLSSQQGKTRILEWGWSPALNVVWVILVGQFLFNFIPYTSDQTVVQRYLTTPTEKQAANGIWVNGLLAVPTALLFFGLGTALFVFFQQRPQLLAPGANDAILPEFIVQQMPTGLAGLVIAGVFAAAMSSLDSSMNSIATAGVNDFYRRFHSTVDEQKALKVAKWITLFVGILGTGAAMWMATLDSRSLFDQFVQLMGMIGGGLAGVFILGMFTEKANSTGAIVGMLTGAMATLLVKLLTPISFFLYAGVGIVVCVTVGYLVSSLRPASSLSIQGLTWWSLPSRSEQQPTASPAS